MQIFSANRHHQEIFTSGVIGCQRCLVEKIRFSVFFGLFCTLYSKLNTFKTSPTQKFIFRRFLTPVVNRILLLDSVWLQHAFKNSHLWDFHYKNTCFLPFMAKVKDLRIWNLQNSIPRQILDLETYNFNQIWFRLFLRNIIMYLVGLTCFFTVEKLKNHCGSIVRDLQVIFTYIAQLFE